MPLARIAVDLTWSGASGGPGANVWHLRADPADTFGSAFQAMIDSIQQFYVSIAALFPTPVTISFSGEVSGVGPDNGTTGTVNGWAVQGSGGAAFMPPANQLLVNWSTGSGGRRGRGRTFIGPLSPNYQEADGTPTSSALTVLGNAAAALVEDSDSYTNGAVVVYSRTDGLARDFTGSTVPNRFSILRSRRD